MAKKPSGKTERPNRFEKAEPIKNYVSKFRMFNVMPTLVTLENLSCTQASELWKKGYFTGELLTIQKFDNETKKHVPVNKYIYYPKGKVPNNPECHEMITKCYKGLFEEELTVPRSDFYVEPKNKK